MSIQLRRFASKKAKIHEFLSMHKGEFFGPTAISRRVFDIDASNHIMTALYALVREGKITSLPRGKYGVAE